MGLKQEKHNLNNTEYKLNFTRQQQANGKYKTKINLVRMEKSNTSSNRGILHKAVNLRSRVTGDTPSLSKAISNYKPTTVKGHIAKGALKSANFITKDVGRTAVDIGLAAETGALKAADVGKRIGRRLPSYALRKLSEKSEEFNFTLKTAGVGGAAVFGLGSHLKAKKEFKLAKADYKLQKSSNKILSKAKKSRVKLEKKMYGTSKFKHDRKQLKFQKMFLPTKTSDKYGEKLRKNLVSSWKTDKKVLINKHRTEVKKLRFSKKETKLQKKIAKGSKPGTLAVKPLKYGSKQLTASAWQKAIYSDPDNDAAKVVGAVSTGAGMVASKFSAQARLERNRKKIKKLKKKDRKVNSKLKKQSAKLQRKSESLKKKRKKIVRKKSTSEKIKEFIASFKSSVRSAMVFMKAAAKEMITYLVAHLMPIGLFFCFIAVIIFAVTGATSSISTFAMGTYTARNADLTNAELYYQQLADEMNSSVLKVGNSSTWKFGLSELGVNTSTMTDKPDSFIWGKSDYLNYDAAYDFDCYKLWSFLCAYYYDTEEKNEYWYFDDDTKDIIEELFDEEYVFEYFYDNTSRWEQLDTYTYDNLYHYASSSGMQGSYGYIEFVGVPSDLTAFSNGNRIYYNYNNGEILNYNDSYAQTGWFVLDERYSVTDPSGNSITAFYQYDENAYSTSSSNGYGRKYVIQGHNVWAPKSYWSFTMDDGTSFSDLFCAVVAPKDVAVYKYRNYALDYITNLITYIESSNSTLDLVKDYWDRAAWYDECYTYGIENDGYTEFSYCQYYQKNSWKTDCRLYYNVKQLKTFDKAIESILKRMDNGDERWDYYNLLVGNDEKLQDRYGNHQIIKNLFDPDEITNGSFRDYTLLTDFGYQMKEWNTTYGSTVNYITLSCPANQKIYAPKNCTIEYDESDENTITLNLGLVNVWYEDALDYKDKDVILKVTISGVSPTVDNGAAVNAREQVATVNSSGEISIKVAMSSVWLLPVVIDPKIILY